MQTHQTLIFMRYLGGTYIPALFVTMGSRRKEDYDVVFRLLTVALQKVDPSWSPDEWEGHLWMCDFELAMRSSIKDNFEKVTLLGCYFHYSQVSGSSEQSQFDSLINFFHFFLQIN